MCTRSRARWAGRGESRFRQEGSAALPVKGTTYLFLLGLGLCIGCGSVHPYAYGRTYRALDAEQPYLEREQAIPYEAVRRDPGGHSDVMLGWFGTVVDVQEGRGTWARVAMDLRFHQERHMCAGQADETCRVTIAHRQGGPFTAWVPIQRGHRSGRDRIGPGSLLKVYGRVQDEFDDRGGPVLKAEYYRHFPTGTYVVAEHGAPQRLRR